MTPLVIGTREDVAGFALAGIHGVACATREEADQAISRADEGVLLIISPEFVRAVPSNRPAIALPTRP
jgi:vacuolar-type H+-ATPase subunit F/Vma7